MANTANKPPHRKVRTTADTESPRPRGLLPYLGYGIVQLYSNSRHPTFGAVSIVANKGAYSGFGSISTNSFPSKVILQARDVLFPPSSWHNHPSIEPAFQSRPSTAIYDAGPQRLPDQFRNSAGTYRRPDVVLKTQESGRQRDTPGPQPRRDGRRKNNHTTWDNSH